MSMKKLVYFLVIFYFIPSIIWAAWPTDSARTKNWGSEVLTDSDLEAQFDLLHTYLNDAFDETTGHKHDGTANEGPLIDLDDDAGIIGVQGVLTVVNGGTGAATLTDGGVLLGSGTGALTAMGVLADGSIIVGDGTTDPTSLAAFSSATGTLKLANGGTGQDLSTNNQGDIYYDGGTNAFTRLTPGTSGQYLKTQGSAANPTWADLSLHPTDTGTISGTSVSITQTISAGDIYKLVFEGSASSTTVSITINSASSGYMYVLNGSNGLAVVTEDEDHTSILLHPDFLDVFNGEITISARGSDTQVSGYIGGADDVATNKVNYSGTFFGNYGGGTPTSIQLVFSQTVTGSYKLYKFN